MLEVTETILRAVSSRIASIKEYSILNNCSLFKSFCNVCKEEPTTQEINAGAIEELQLGKNNKFIMLKLSGFVGKYSVDSTEEEIKAGTYILNNLRE